VVDADIAWAFDPIGVMASAFDDAGTGSLSPGRVEVLEDLGEGVGYDRGQVVRGKKPPDHRSGGVRGGRCG
jgi:hypothetical protein